MLEPLPDAQSGPATPPPAPATLAARAWRLAHPRNLLSDDPRDVLIPAAILVLLARLFFWGLAEFVESRYATPRILPIVKAFCLLLVIRGVLGCMALPFALVGIVFPRVGKYFAFMSITFAALFLVSRGAGRASWGVTRREVQSFAAEAEPLIDAIKRYNADRGSPPDSLADLVPGYLQTLPKPNLWWMGDYQYYGPNRPGRFDGNDWALEVEDRSSAPFGFDFVVYLPQHRPDDFYYYGGLPERIGDWVYIHE